MYSILKFLYYKEYHDLKPVAAGREYGTGTGDGIFGIYTDAPDPVYEYGAK